MINESTISKYQPLIETIKEELLDSFKMYANEDYCSDPLPICQIVFAAEGLICDEPDFLFAGYGAGTKGERFSACGGFILDELFPVDDSDKYYETQDECFELASEIILHCFEQVGNSAEFKAIPTEAPVAIKLVIVDQKSKPICRIHPDGKIELPPKK